VIGKYKKREERGKERKKMVKRSEERFREM
jgi:hypothetical protein